MNNLFGRILAISKRADTASARLARRTTEGHSFRFDWRLLVTKYDLNMWLLQNSPHMARRTGAISQLEHLHNDLNYLHARSNRRVNSKDWYSLWSPFMFLAVFTFPNHPKERPMLIGKINGIWNSRLRCIVSWTKEVLKEKNKLNKFRR